MAGQNSDEKTMSREERIWAPWRIGYIVGENRAAEELPAAQLLPGAEPDCFLCRCAATTDQRKALVVYRDELVLTVLNRYPYNNGHLLVAPLRHCGRLEALSQQEDSALLQALKRFVVLLEKLLRPEGFNVGLNLGRVAGAGLPGHLHWHVVPRWGGDTNFMPVLAGVRVVPQSLEAVWELLHEELSKQQQGGG